jgi:cytosol alanyl aminopeptidase
VPARAPAQTGVTPAGSRLQPPALRLDGSVVPLENIVELSLDPARSDFEGTVTIPVEVKRATQIIWLHGKRLEISSASVTTGKEMPVEVSQHGELLALALPEPVGPGRARIRLQYRGQMPTTEQEGLFRQTEAGRTYIYTQFEPTAARLAFPCFDEPAYKVPWQLTLRVPAGLVALSNTLPEKEETTAQGQTVVFRRSAPLPSYLYALAVGPFDLVDLGKGGRKQIPMRIAVPRGRGAETRYAREVTGQLLDTLERYFEMPYPYEKLDSVVLPTFLGAMENPGLITYTASVILAKPNEETPAFQHGYARTAAHELAHQWFGDLVTMAWWDDIWLNESFATFMADRVLDDWRKGWGIPAGRVRQAERAFEADSLVTARKIHNPIREHNDIIGAFDSISYAKGGSLLDMFEGWMGRAAFQKAVRRYLQRHAFGNATSRDFIAALAAESRPEVAAGFGSFLEQGGIPLVSLALDCSAGKPPELVLGQERFLPVGSRGSAAQTWSVPMCVGFPRKKDSAVQCFLLSTANARVPLETVGCPEWVDGNLGGRGYYRLDYAADLGSKLLARSARAHATDLPGRISALLNARALVDAGRRPIGDLLRLLPVVAQERDPHLLDVAAALATSIEPYVTSEQRASYGRFLASAFARHAREMGWKGRPSESPQASRLRPRLLELAAVEGKDPALIAQARRLAEGYLANPTTLDPRSATVALTAAARVDATLFDRLEKAFSKTEDRQVRAALLAGMVSSRGPGHLDRTLRRLTDGSLQLDELATLLLTAMKDPERRDPTFDFLVESYPQITGPLSPYVRPALVRVAGSFCDHEHRQQADTSLRAKVKDLPGGTKTMDETVEALDLCIARRARFEDDIAAFLARQAPGRS